MAKLILRDGKGSEDVHEISDDVTSFGRSSANIIKVKDEQSSRQHCRIEKIGDGYRLVDLGSRNGTKVNGVEVSSQTLKPGDNITIGEYSITFDEKVEVSAEELGATVAVDPAAVEAATAPGGDGKKDPLADQMAPQFVVEVVEGETAGTKIELGVDPVTIGRNASNKLVINDEAASNYHAEITKEAIGYVVSDLGSTNGTKVNGEKIVKSPLAHGSKVRIGSTVIVFKNLGAPTEEDAVFGTVVLDSDKLELELAAAKSSGGAGRVLAALVLVALIGLGAYGVTKLIKGGDNGNNNNNNTVTITEVRNPSFGEGTDSNGNPREWKVFVDHGNRVILDKKEGREAGTKEKPKYSVKFQRDEGARQNALMACQQAGTFGVKKGSGYRATAWVLCPGALGLYGVRVTWVGSGQAPRQLEQYATISGAHPEWKEVKLEAQPPRWASKMRLALVAWGNTDSVWFDDVALEEVDSSEVPKAEDTVEFKGVNADLDRSGRLSLGRGGVAALTGLIVAKGQGGVDTDQNLAHVASGFPRAEGGRSLFRGAIYDFARNRTFNYDLTAGKGSEGVSLNYSFATMGHELTLDSLSLRFTIEPAFAGSPEIYTSDGKKAFTSGSTSGVDELVLRSNDKELVLSFDKPATLSMTPRGEKRELVILLAKNPSLSSAPRSFALEFGSRSARAAADKSAAFETVFRLFDDRKWDRFPAAARGVRRRFPDAADELKKLGSMERQYAKALADARSSADAAVKLADDALGVDAWQLAYDSGKVKLNKLKSGWTGTPLTGHIDKCLVKLEEGKTRLAKKAREAEARKWLKKAQGPLKTNMWALAKVYATKVLNDFADTSAAADAKKIMEMCDTNIKRDEMIIKKEEELLRKIKNYVLNKQYKQAVRMIETDSAYRKYKDEMREIKEKLEDLKAKIK